MLLDALGNVSQGMLAKLLGVISHVAVYKWVRAAGEGTPAPSATPSSGIVQIDEMWHFVEGKKQGGSYRVSGWSVWEGADGRAERLWTDPPASIGVAHAVPGEPVVADR